MKVDCEKKGLIRKAVCFAKALDIHAFDLKIIVTDKGSYCQRNDDGSFLINITSGLDKYWQSVHLAHEMVHLRQYKRDELVGEGDETGATWWKGELYPPVEFMSDEYYLAPWEMEARALEGWLVQKWRKYKSELH